MLLVWVPPSFGTSFGIGCVPPFHFISHTEICDLLWHVLNTTQPLKKNEILPFSATWMDLEGTMLRASLVPQRLKHLPAMRETWVRSLGWEDPLEKEMATHSSILA